MRTGCIVTLVIVLIALALAGYYGYHIINESFGIPDDLTAYSEPEEMLGKINSKAPAPPDTAHLTPERVGLFIRALDSVETGWRGLESVLDSLGIGKEKSGTEFDIATSPAIIREAIRVPLITRRALVAYLNANNLSWDEYLWLKERVVAASGIERQEFDSAVEVVLENHITMGETSSASGGDGLKGASALFRRAEELRARGAIDSADIALVAPYRKELLSRGLPALAGLETDDEAVNASVNFKSKNKDGGAQ